MKTLTVNKWSVGIDVRKPASVSSANRLVDLKNAYINTGKTITKRKGTLSLGDVPVDTFGMYSANGMVQIFGSQAPATVTVPAGVTFNQITNGTLVLTGIHSAVLFNGFIFVCADWSGTSRYHYLDGNLDTFESSCPHSPVFAVAGSKVYAKDGDIVRFCEVNNPRAWNSIDNAGFIATGNFTDTSTDVTALSQYRNALIVMHNNRSLEWAVDPDPSLTSHRSTIFEGSNEHRSLANVTGDLYFLSESGFRSIAVQNNVESLADMDVGSPIDNLIVPLSKAGAISLYNHKDGQYWCALGNKVWIYSFSKTAKLSAWSYYEYAFTIDDMMMHNNEVVFKSGTSIYITSASVYSDNGVNYETVVEFSDLDFKANTALKQVHSFDIAQVGNCTAEFTVGIENKTTTHAVSVVGDFRDRGMIALPLVATHVQPKFTNNDDQFWELNLVNITFNPMGIL
jgi:hypothetical protein